MSGARVRVTLEFAFETDEERATYPAHDPAHEDSALENVSGLLRHAVTHINERGLDLAGKDDPVSGRPTASTWPSCVGPWRALGTRWCRRLRKKPCGCHTGASVRDPA